MLGPRHGTGESPYRSSDQVRGFEANYESCKILYRLVEERETPFASFKHKEVEEGVRKTKNEEKCREAMLQI